MKHSAFVTAILVAVFCVSQLIGLGLIAAGTNITTGDAGERVVVHQDTALGARPIATGLQSFMYVLVGVGIGTAVLLFLIRFKLIAVWRTWFFIAVWLASTVSLGAVLPTAVALALALVLAAWKVWRPNVIVHNVTEVLVYTGIVLLIAPIFDVFYAALLLIVISLYDAYAVWHSKHMVRMAQFQTESKLFAGLFVPYSAKGVTRTMRVAAKPATQAPKAEGRSAILGGGDIAFPMLFAGAVLDRLVRDGLTVGAAYVQSLLVVAGATLAIALLFVFAKQDRFYPAMPFISAGCFVGFGALALL